MDNKKLITIDYLILNFEGVLTNNIYDTEKFYSEQKNPFTMELHEYGNKIFKNVYDIFYNGVRLGVLNSVPRSNIINEKLIQLQFENSIFYTQSLEFLNECVTMLVNYFEIEYTGVNRLDIAIDTLNQNNNYQNLISSIINSEVKIKGRSKAIQLYYETHNGNTFLNGFSVGKRSASRFLRVYNKTLSLLQSPNPKTYITDYLTNNGFNSSDVWRFEYQLNSSFFSYLMKKGTDKVHQHIFSIPDLINLIELAEKNHFEIVLNTGKKETNKEKSIIVNCWETIRTQYKTTIKNCLSRIKKVFETSLLIQKRLIKSLFRNYYINQKIEYYLALYQVLKEYNLFDYFREKFKFYVYEFENKEKVKNTFSADLYKAHKNLLIKYSNN